MLHLILALMLWFAPVTQVSDTCTAADIAGLDDLTRRALDSQTERIERLNRVLDGFDMTADAAELIYWAFTAEASLHDTYAEAVYPDCLLPLLDSYTTVVDDMYAVGAMLLWRQSNDNALAVERMLIALDARLAQAARHIDDWQLLYVAYERLP